MIEMRSRGRNRWRRGEKWGGLPQESLDVVVPCTIDPKRLCSPAQWRGKEEIFTIPERNHFVSSSMNDVNRTGDRRDSEEPR
jgi:hypothetical protein